MDTTRADRIGCYGYPLALTPTVDGLAEEGVLFERAYCSVPLTGPSHATILTGLHPPGHGVRANVQHVGDLTVPTLGTVLQDAGYRTGAVIASYVLDRRYGLSVGFDEYIDQIEGQDMYRADYAEIRAAEVTRRAKDWLSGVPDSRPFFLWVHYYDPHAKYEAPGSDPSLPPDVRYDEEIAYTDEAIGALLAHLSPERAENTIVVFAADHGESLGEHGEITHGMLTYESVMHVPFIIRPAGSDISPRQVPDMVRLVDIVPTVLDMVDLPAPESHGRSLVPLMRGEPDEGEHDQYFECMGGYYIFGWGKITGIHTETHKLILAPVPELYDIISDPAEKYNLYDSDSDLTMDLTFRYEDLAEEVGAGADMLDTEFALLSPEEQERLRSLGYMSRRPGVESQEDRNPKDHITMLYAILDLYEKLSEGRFATVEEDSEKLLKIDPENQDIVGLLAVSKLENGKPQESAEVLEAYLADHPGADILRRDLGHVYSTMGRLTDAVSAWQMLADQEVKDPQVYEQLASHHIRTWPGHAPDVDSALECIREALDLGSRRYDILGRVYLAKGEPDRAVEVLQANLDNCVDNRGECEQVLANCMQILARMNGSSETGPQ